MSFYLFLALFGIIGGFLAGLAGIGGGIIYVAVLPYVLRKLGVPETEIAQYTIANSVFAVLFATASANFTLLKSKLFYLRETLWMSISAVGVGIPVLIFIVNTPMYSTEKFSIIIIILIVIMLIGTLFKAKRKSVEIKTENGKLTLLQLIISGGFSGAVSALSGLGGGVIIIPLLTLLFKTSIKKAAAISFGVIFVNALGITLINLFETPVYTVAEASAGYIIFPIALTLSLGVIPASYFGVKTAGRLSEQTGRLIFAAILILVIVNKIAELI